MRSSFFELCRFYDILRLNPAYIEVLFLVGEKIEIDTGELKKGLCQRGTQSAHKIVRRAKNDLLATEYILNDKSKVVFILVICR